MIVNEEILINVWERLFYESKSDNLFQEFYLYHDGLQKPRKLKLFLFLLLKTSVHEQQLGSSMRDTET